MCLKAPAGANVFGVRDELVWPHPSLDSGSGGNGNDSRGSFYFIVVKSFAW